MKFSTFLLASVAVVLDSGFVRGQFRGTTTGRQPNVSRALAYRACKTLNEMTCNIKMRCVYSMNMMCRPKPCITYKQKRACNMNKKKCVWDKKDKCIKKTKPKPEPETPKPKPEPEPCETYEEDECKENRGCVYNLYDDGKCNLRPCYDIPGEKGCTRQEGDRCVWIENSENSGVCFSNEESCETYGEDQCKENRGCVYNLYDDGKCNLKPCYSIPREIGCTRQEGDRCVWIENSGVCFSNGESCETYGKDQCELNEPKCVHDEGEYYEGECNFQPCDSYSGETVCTEQEGRCAWNGNSDVCIPKDEESCETHGKVQCVAKPSKCVYDGDEGKCNFKQCDSYRKKGCTKQKGKCAWNWNSDVCIPKDEESCETYGEDQCKLNKLECVYDDDECNFKQCDSYFGETGCTKQKGRCAWNGKKGVCIPKDEESCETYGEDQCKLNTECVYGDDGECNFKPCDSYPGETQCTKQEGRCDWNENSGVCFSNGESCETYGKDQCLTEPAKCVYKDGKCSPNED